MTKEEIESLQWHEQTDRGMAENNGYLFKRGAWSLQYWKTHPRFAISKYNKVEYDTGTENPRLTIDDLKAAMKKLKIIS